MKRSSNLSFPHPVIGNGDDAAGSFEPELSRSNDRRTLILRVKNLNTQNQNLSDHIAQGHARYVLRVECGASGYRRSFLTESDLLEAEIPLDELYREVNIESGVVAIQSIPDYRPSDPHPDYGDATFAVEPGEVLAVGPGWRLSITTDWDPLRAPVPSIMRIMEDQEKEEGPIVAALHGNKIIVRVSKKDYRQYLIRKNDSADILHSTLVFPVLLHAITVMSDSEYADQQWAVRLRDIMAKKQIDPEDPLRAAQEVIDLPVQRSLTCLDGLLREGSDA